eukprot:CAMPEP_0171101850 /NCGR_PEP_ID=MMETSP0766_2-20121228/56128_1 /TAXON_ID=439317 /ORGANISM="Gambierdiscus australes, Strain CAWD 149" /LENGTH=128 /DNA_ID=CAMNT_0011561991 /DNA_START=132 /DNA_END=518 /DNA_ORIENTATION=-
MTPLGECQLHVGGLIPCDNRHAPVRPYRSFGDWFEQGRRDNAPAPPAAAVTSPCWPYGQDVTKLYQTDNKRHTFRIDGRLVERVQPYAPPKSASLPDLHRGRSGTRRHAEHIDEQYHRTFRALMSGTR